MRRPKRPRRWALLIHQIPPEPLYLRAKIRQRLARVGAIPLKNAVYVLPFSDESLEDLQWIAQETVSGGGDAHVCAAEFADPRTDAEIERRFRSERAAEYAALVESLREARSGTRGTAEELAAFGARARRRFEEIAGRDVFPGAARAAAEKALEGVERMAERPAPRGGPARRAVRFSGRTWTTRRGVAVDRIASAWLIRRFLDPKARFRFVDPAATRRAGELRFDMVGGDFTHEGNRCTFETLLARHSLADPALEALGQIVHDIDLKDGKYERAEAPGVERVLAGLVRAEARDARRLDRGFALFDELYASFRQRAAASPKITRRSRARQTGP